MNLLRERYRVDLVELQTATHTNEQLGDWIRDRLAVVLDNNNIDAAEETGAVGGGGNGKQDLLTTADHFHRDYRGSRRVYRDR